MDRTLAAMYQLEMNEEMKEILDNVTDTFIVGQERVFIYGVKE